MSNKIDIEFCGGWGYGGPANNLKKAIAAKFPGVEINNHSAKGMTSKIEVGWMVNGQKKIIWSEGKQKTEQNHNTIIDLLNNSRWTMTNR